MRSLCQVMPPELPLLVLLISQLIPAGVADESGESLSNRPSKQQPRRNSGFATPRENVNAILSTSAAASGTEPKLPVVEDASIETEADEAKPTRPGTRSDGSRTSRRDDKRRKVGSKRPNPAVESAKSAIIREFVASHGDRISKSRKHADLFDGSGYLIDMMKELHHYESRAEDEKAQDHHRRKRSTAAAAADGEENDNPDLPHFASLSEALAHLNGGHQRETISADFNVRFIDDDKEEAQEGGKEDGLESAPKPPRRRKRSLGNPDDDEEGHGDDPDWWLRDGVDDKDDDEETEEKEKLDEVEEEIRRHREAAESMERLDADLKELAKYLDDQAAEEHLQQQQQQQQQQQALPNPLGNFNRGIRTAYKSLSKLRDLAQDALSSKNDAEPQQPPRMQDLYPDKTANWRIDADALDETMRDLKKYYRSIDEL